ncbi:hypothetical protein F66182_11666 [Fusarium sp. NRRL 66182]|nr:hypothetical protein F66182_11666 [Fusarium sp. NRRL 66182]
MDITRGSRRARHVAAAHANTNINASSPSGPAAPSDIASSPQVAETPSGSSYRLPPGQGASPATAWVTPDGPPPLLHRTPDQPPDPRRRRAPPPNPFRLYTTAASACGIK